MSFHVRKFCNAAFVLIESDLDVLSSGPLYTEIVSLSAVSEYVIVSLEDCSYCDLTGLRTLLAAKRWLGDRLKVVIPSHHAAHRLMKIVAVEDVVQACASFGEALTRCVLGET